MSLRARGEQWANSLLVPLRLPRLTVKSCLVWTVGACLSAVWCGLLVRVSVLLCSEPSVLHLWPPMVVAELMEVGAPAILIYLVVLIVRQRKLDSYEDSYVFPSCLCLQVKYAWPCQDRDFVEYFAGRARFSEGMRAGWASKKECGHT